MLLSALGGASGLRVISVTCVGGIFPNSFSAVIVFPERSIIRAVHAVANCSGPTRDLPASRQTQTSADCLQVDHARSSLRSQETNRTTQSLVQVDTLGQHRKSSHWA